MPPSSLRIVAGTARGRRLEAPPGEATRPTADRAREALFGILGHGTPALSGSRFLDLFAGSGAVGFEAWSRGASAVTLVERDRQALSIIRRNQAVLGAESLIVLAQDVLALGGCPGAPFDIVFMDPPYGSGAAGPALARLQAGGWLAAASRLVVEVAAKEPFAPPEGFAIADERRYGAARFVFLAALQEEG